MLSPTWKMGSGTPVSGLRDRPWPWWLFPTLKTQAYNFFLPFTSTIAGTRPRCRVTATTTNSVASPALEDIKSTIVIRIYSCNVPQDRVMGCRECRDIILLWPGSKAATFPDITASICLWLFCKFSPDASSSQCRQMQAANQSWALGG